MVYLDILFLFNFIVDHLILILVKEKHYPELKNGRILAGSFMAAMTYIIWWCFLNNAPMLLRTATALVFISTILIWTYRIKSGLQLKRTLASTILYLFLLGGLGNVLEKVAGILHIFDVGDQSGQAGGFFFCMVAFTTFFIRKERRDRKTEKREEGIYEVQIVRKDRSVSLIGFYDSGNLLVSEMTGRGICVLPYREAKKIMSESEKEKVIFLIRQKEFSWRNMTEYLCSGIYKINYSSVGKVKGWMPGILAEHIIVKKNGELLADRGGMIGMTFENISQEGRFTALLPADIFVTR